MARAVHPQRPPQQQWQDKRKAPTADRGPEVCVSTVCPPPTHTHTHLPWPSTITNDPCSALPVVRYRPQRPQQHRRQDKQEEEEGTLDGVQLLYGELASQLHDIDPHTGRRCIVTCHGCGLRRSVMVTPGRTAARHAPVAHMHSTAVRDDRPSGFSGILCAALRRGQGLPTFLVSVMKRP